MSLMVLDREGLLLQLSRLIIVKVENFTVFQKQRIKQDFTILIKI